LQRCARLLAGDIASWVIVDVERSGGFRRQFAVGPRGEQADELARKIRGRARAGLGARPGPRHGRSVVLAHADDAGYSAPPGRDAAAHAARRDVAAERPDLGRRHRYGVLTLARQAAEGRFTMADLALATELGEHLGVAIRSTDFPAPFGRGRGAAGQPAASQVARRARARAVRGLRPGRRGARGQRGLHDVSVQAAGPSRSATCAARDSRPPR